MLYDQWRQIARGCERLVALWDLPSNRRWTFGELADVVESRPVSEGRVSFPQGVSAEFVIDVLCAWRDAAVVCPLEVGQTRPMLDGFALEQIVHLKTTSASTGQARMVAFTADQLAADVRNIVETMGLRPAWPNIGSISLSHSYGFSNLVLPLLLHGVPLIVIGEPLPEAVRRGAAMAPHVTLAAVPALWRAWQAADAIPDNLRLAISAGTPLPLALEQSVFTKRGLKIHNFYGSSECGGIAYDATEEPRVDAACAGSPLKGVDLRVAGDGCLTVRGRAVGYGYWPESSDRLVSGVFRTTDLAEINDGLVYLRGRASDQINVAGRKVEPEAIERVLATHPAVRECVVFGIPSHEPERGETIVACVSAPTRATEELRNHLIRQLPSWQVPREWWFVDSIEADQRGKVGRAQWRKRYLGQNGKSPGA